MFGRKVYLVVIVSMLLLAAFGTWVMVDSAIAYRSAPRIEEQSRDRNVQSRLHPLTEGRYT